MMVVEDKPLRDEVMLMERLGDAVEDSMGWLAEAQEAAEQGLRAASGEFDSSGARRALIGCQDKFNRLTQEYFSDLASYERIDELVKFGLRSRGERLRWSNAVKQALEEYQQPLQDAAHALFLCWQELVDRLGIQSVSVHTTNIGQKIVSDVRDGKRPLVEELT
jgi:hypothetical protein